MWWKKSTCISTKLNELQVSRYPEDHAIDESFDWTMKFFKNSCFSNFLHLGRICLNNKTTDTNKVVYSTVPWAGHPRKTMAGVEQVNFPSKALQRTWHTQTMARSEDWVPSKRFSQMFVPQRWRVKECKSNPWPCFGICFVACLMWCFFGFFQSNFKVNPLGMKWEQGGSCEAHNIWTVPCPSMPTRNKETEETEETLTILQGFRSIFSVALDNSFASCHGTNLCPPPNFNSYKPQKNSRPAYTAVVHHWTILGRVRRIQS